MYTVLSIVYKKELPRFLTRYKKNDFRGINRFSKTYQLDVASTATKRQKKHVRIN